MHILLTVRYTYCKVWTKRICMQWRASLVGDHFLYSPDLNVQFKGDAAGRNLKPFTLRGSKVKMNYRSKWFYSCLMCSLFVLGKMKCFLAWICPNRSDFYFSLRYSWVCCRYWLKLLLFNWELFISFRESLNRDSISTYLYTVQ